MQVGIQEQLATDESKPTLRHWEEIWRTHSSGPTDKVQSMSNQSNLTRSEHPRLSSKWGEQASKEVINFSDAHSTFSQVQTNKTTTACLTCFIRRGLAEIDHLIHKMKRSHIVMEDKGNTLRIWKLCCWVSGVSGCGDGKNREQEIFLLLLWISGMLQSFEFFRLGFKRM